MKLARKIRFWLGGLFFRGRFNAEMEEEMQMHLELRIERNIAAGMTPGAARDTARRAFGGIDQIKERARDRRGGSWFVQLCQDFRYGLRMLKKSPVFTAVAVLSLALGIGAATSIFSLINAILLGSLSVPNPQDLRVICWSGSDAHMDGYMSSGDPPATLGRRAGASFSKDAFHFLRAQCADKCDIFAYAPLYYGKAKVRGEAFGVHSVLVSGNCFPGLDVRPLLGTLLTMLDEDPEQSPRAVISYLLWERHFGLDPSAVGQQIVLNGTSFTIAGVLPREFAGIVPGTSPDLYVSMSQAPAMMKFMQPDSPGFWWMTLMGRVRPGTSDAGLKATADSALRGCAGKYITDPSSYIAEGRDGPKWDRMGYRSQLQLLLAVVGIVVLVACANLAGLLLARGASRQHELAVRGALGAGRGRLIRQLLTESTLLSLLGGGLGVLLALWGRNIVSQLLAGSPDGLRYDTKLDLKVMGFAVAVTLLTVLLAGLFPAFKGGGVKPNNGLKDRASIGAPRLRAGRFLVTAQIALSLLLVTGAGLYVRTLVNLIRIDPGFAIDHLLLFSLHPGDSGYDNEGAVEYFDQVQRSLSAIPGVRSATLANMSLLGGGVESASFSIPDHPADKGTSYRGANVLTVGDQFFETMGIPLMAGRELRAGDSGGSAKVIVVNESFVREFFSGESPLGRTLDIAGGLWQIVGVCRDAKYNSIKDAAGPTAYFPFRQRQLDNATIALRTVMPPRSLAATVRKAVAAIDVHVAVSHFDTEEDMRNNNITTERMFAECCGALAILALFLSAIGLYGLIAYDMTRRTSEFGVRMALGATPRQLLGPILGKAVALAFAGIVAGLPLTMGLTRVTRSNLYGVTSSDPATFAVAAVLLLSVMLAAAWIPARRATKIDPMVALRCD